MIYDASIGEKMQSQTMSAVDAVDLVAEYIAHGLAIPLTLKQALDADTLEALNEIEDRINVISGSENPSEPHIAGVHSPSDAVLCAETI